MPRLTSTALLAAVCLLALINPAMSFLTTRLAVAARAGFVTATRATVCRYDNMDLCANGRVLALMCAVCGDSSAT